MSVIAMQAAKVLQDQALKDTHIERCFNTLSGKALG